MIGATYQTWSAQPWLEVDTEALVAGNDALLKLVRSFASANPAVKGWGVYQTAEQRVKDMGVVLPLVNALHAKSMQPRHWKSLSMVCQAKSFDPRDPKLCLRELLDLNLHLHVDDVSEVVEVSFFFQQWILA